MGSPVGIVVGVTAEVGKGEMGVGDGVEVEENEGEERGGGVGSESGVVENEKSQALKNNVAASKRESFFMANFKDAISLL
ncbi:MAG: hypothetical protein A2V81_00350 [Candidatus Abawacabacteria bacterium RBG_16_42_10]|uniref:Uncharacterized protein n=1 Tax=Candidatus Abawacabacteria bacterium RBG_16_42_10 TaxID=1817814 RepID=A0A1F4XIW3_9BACT|nr:MAG: hypothetical protein A2V81_00350 [Candidatus Abawacabacteria bacterium RBG_16_42_10]